MPAAQEGQAKFSFFTAMCFTLNYIIGSGFLTLPWAFQSAGFGLGILSLCITSFFSILAALFLLEAMARAHVVILYFRRYDSHVLIPIEYDHVNDDHHQAKLYTDERSEGEEDQQHQEEDVGLIVKDKKFEVSELCEEFLGVNGERTYTLFVVMYLYGTLWAYATVFANALSSVMIQQRASYYFFLLVFGAIVVPLSLSELSEQVGVQVAMSIWRIVMLILMVGTLALSAWTHTKAFSDFDPGVLSVGDAENKLYAFRLDHLDILLPITTYAFIFHHSVPALSQPMGDKKQLGLMFASVLIVCLVGYACVGSVVSIYFKDSIHQASNLNWAKYVGTCNAATPDECEEKASIVAMCISRFVVLFPAFDVASAYPLNAITLGDNIMSYVYGSSKVHRVGRVKARVRFFRTLASLPPVIAAMFVHQLGAITDYTGVAGFAIAFVFPPLLAMRSEQRLLSLGIDPRTAYSHRLLTGTAMQYVTLLLGMGLVVFVTAGLLLVDPDDR